MKDKHDLEVYAPIDGFPDYLVTSYGRVFSLKHGKLKELKQAKNKQGYLVVCLCKNNKKINKRVHRLVAQSFIPNPNNKQQVNHIDENKENNNVSNLEWMTHKENNDYGTRNQRISKAISGEKSYMFGKESINRKKVLRYKNEEIKIYSCIKDVEKDGFNPSHISDCCKGKRKSHKGYQWFYLENYNREVEK